jgi:hypothetical protein
LLSLQPRVAELGDRLDAIAKLVGSSHSGARRARR